MADTPGFGNADFEFDDLLTFSQTFKEFFKNSNKCKFARCLHIDEPDCQIKRMVENGEIIKSRYENYLLFTKEIKEKIKYKY
jgi:ribosome biogenesis GTPase